MKAVKFEEVKWIYSDELDVYVGLAEDLPENELADIVYARLDPGQTLKRHYHHRAQDGYEAFFFYNGGHLRVLLDDDASQEFNRTDPFHLTFDHEEIHGITNLSSSVLYFEVLCTPRHVEGEEVVVDRSAKTGHNS
jgi:hypothetical protein